MLKNWEREKLSNKCYQVKKLVFNSRCLVFSVFGQFFPFLFLFAFSSQFYSFNSELLL